MSTRIVSFAAGALLLSCAATAPSRVSDAEFAAGMKKHFSDWDRDKSGSLDQREIAEGLQKLVPAPRRQ